MRPFPNKFYDFDRAEREYGRKFDVSHKRPAEATPNAERFLQEWRNKRGCFGYFDDPQTVEVMEAYAYGRCAQLREELIRAQHEVA